MKRLITITTLVIASCCICSAQVSNAQVKGRSVVGSMPRPSYDTQPEGIVVVKVKIDQYGNVKEATPGTEGTTVKDKKLWNAALNAALKTTFNMDASAPDLQSGTITYSFSLDTSPRSVATPQKELISIKEFVEGNGRGIFCVKGRYVKTYSARDLLFTIEDEDYIIPVKLVKKDLGAEKRFLALNLQPGDTLTIEGQARSIDVEFESFRGLDEATIINRSKSQANNHDSEPLYGSHSESIPFQLVEKKPSFNGGDANEFSKWVNAHLVYPDIAQNIQGRVTVQFTIEADGRVTGVKVLRGVDEALDKEAVRVVSSSPQWEPGRMKGKAVAVIYTFPVIFQLR